MLQEHKPGYFYDNKETVVLDKTASKKKNIATLVKNGMAKIRPAKGKPFMIDIGCGQNKQPDHIGIDIESAPNVDYVMDIRKTPWPIESGAVERIFTSHFFEHLDGPERVAFCEEAWRVLEVSGQLIIIGPYWSSRRAVQDPYHKWPPLAETSFLYFVEHWRKDQHLDHYPIKCNFNFSYGFATAPELNAKSDDVRQFAQANYVNAISDIHVTMTKIELGKR